MSERRRWTAGGAGVLLGALVAACDSSSSDGDVALIGAQGPGTPQAPGALPVDDAGPPRYVGLVDLSFRRFEESGGYVIAQFGAVDRTAAAAFDALSRGADACLIGRRDNIAGLDGENPWFGLTPVPAGESIVVSAPGGTLMTIAREELEDLDGNTVGHYYSSDDSDASLDMSLPPALVLDVPGEVFPPAAGIPLPDAPPPVGDRSTILLSPESRGELARDTVFRWRPSAAPADVLVLSFTGRSDRDELTQDYCFVVDDGEFSLSATLWDELGIEEPSDMRIGLPTFAGLSVTRRGEALIVATHAEDGLLLW